MKLTKNQIIIIGSIALVVLILILILTGVIPGLKSGPETGQEKINLTFWGVEDGRVMNSAIGVYRGIYKNTNIKYEQFNESEYEDKLIDALASGKGPDIFMFHNTWLTKHKDKIKSLAETQFQLANFRQLYPTIIEQDFISFGEDGSAKIYAFPLYIDTIALLYNKEMFEAKAQAINPRTWADFKNLISRFTEKNQLNQVIKSAGAIGGSEKSIFKATDILSILIMQFGNQITKDKNRVAFGNAGLEAFNFYLQFANPISPYYTWNDNLAYSLDNFSQGGTAMIFSYSSVMPALKKRNPFLSVGVSPMLQVDINKPINYANYWGLAVSDQSKNASYAWQFILSLTTDANNSEQYLKEAVRPPAIRSLIQKYINDSNLGVFNQQSLTARSWNQFDNVEIRKILSNMIESALNARLSPKDALDQAETEINSLVK